MATVVSRLLEEHDLIRRFSSVLEWLSIRLGSGAGIDEDFAQALLSMLSFVEGCHHAKEEQVLFPALANVAGASRLVDDAVADHREFSSLASRIRDSISSGDLRTASDACSLASSLLKRHISWEEAGLFAMAEASLPDEVKEDVSRRLAEYGGCSAEAASRDLDVLYKAMGGD